MIIRWIAGLSAAIAIAIIGLLPVLRNSEAFQATSPTDPGSRIQAIRLSNSELASPNRIALIARDLYAWSDPYLFREPGRAQPPAGSKRLGNLLYLWAPRAWVPNRPEINDGHLIAKEIMGTPTAGMIDGRHIWFPGISFGADLYWRFRWPGVAIGGLVFGLFYAGLCRAWYALADLNKSTASALIALYPATFLQGPPLRSLMETAWNWLYEFPKYLLILAVVACIIETVSRLTTRPPHAPES